MRWSWEAARAAGAGEIGQLVSDNDQAAAALLQAHGYTVGRTAWLLETKLERAPAAPVLPAGYAFRSFVPGQDDRAAHALIEGAFGEWRTHGPEPFADWEAETLLRPGFTPADLTLVVRGEEVVGALMFYTDGTTGWVDQLAVARAHRGRGLARALLHHAFADGWRRGCRECALMTDSRTGALAFYERVGMSLRRSHTYFVKPL
jgi:ribosomal protein S18 acetylase RimI-like enzyme